MKSKSLLLLLFIGFSFALNAQCISVKSFKLLPTDMTAGSLDGKRIDQNNEVAALIKIVTTQTGFTFEAGALGIVDTRQEAGEVWVWVPRGSRKITIKHPQLGVLREYRYPIEIEAERTYEMQLTTSKVVVTLEEEIQQQYLTFQISPTNAMLEVNGQLWEVGPDGSSTKFVDLGTYKYRVQAPNYHSDAGMVTADEPGGKKQVTITLKPDFVEVTLKADTDAEIWVNNEKKGVGSWTGPLGKGTYMIECKKVNHETSRTSQEITDALNGSTITLPAPQPIYGSLNIESTPNYATVYLDGKKIGETPKFVKEILVGTHEIKVSKDEYNNYVEAMTVTKGEKKQIKVVLEEKDAKTKEKELAWKNSFFPVFADKGVPFYYEIGLWDDDDDAPDTETEYRYKDINGKIYPDGVLFAHNQRLAVKENGKLVIYSVDGRKFGPFDGLSVVDYPNQAYENNIKILKDGKCGLIDKDGNQLIPPIYEKLEAFKNLQEMMSPQLYMAEKNGKMGVINIHNDIVEPFVYTPRWSSVYDFVVEKDEKQGCLDAMTGKLVIPCKYKYINTNANGDIIVAENENNQYGIINREGKPIHPFEYTYISDREAGRLYKLDKEKNSTSLLMNSKGKIIANDCCALGVVLESKYDLFVYCRWKNKEKNEKEWCLADINTGEIKTVINPNTVKECRLDLAHHYYKGRYYKCERKNKNTNETEQGIWDLFTQKLVIPYSAGELYYEYNDSHEIVSCTRYSDHDNSKPCDITFYNFPEGKVTNTYKDVMISGFHNTESGLVIMLDNNNGFVVDDFGNPIISCECWNGDEDNTCYNLCGTKDFIVDANKGVYDTKGNLLIEGQYGDILEDNDLKCIVLYRLGDSRKTGKNSECYVYENGKLKQVEDKGSLSELVLSVIQQRCKN